MPTQVNSSKVAHLKTVGITLPINLVQKARKYGLNISFIARKALIQEINRIEGRLSKTASNSQPWWARRDLNPRPTGYERFCSSRPVCWVDLRDRFLVWGVGRFSRGYLKNLRVVLDRFQPVIGCVEDVDGLFAVPMKESVKRELWFAVRNLFKFCLEHGWDREWIRRLMDAMPKCPQSRVDLRRPRVYQILNLLKALREAPIKYQAFYNLILDSAVRPFHAIEVLQGWNEENLERVRRGVYMYYVGIEREEKHCWIIFVTRYTLNLIGRMREAPTIAGYCCFQKRMGLLRPKLVQKFAYNSMRSCGVDRDIAEFLSGRKPQGIGAKHYTELVFLAEKQYPKYARFLEKLRRNV